MGSGTATAIVFGGLVIAVWAGRMVRARLPKEHLDGDTRDSVKLAVGVISTMAALLLGLLVNSAKGDFDARRATVTQMAQKIAFLDRVLAMYGSEASEARARLRSTTEDTIRRMWPDSENQPVELQPNGGAGTETYHAIQLLSPQSESQRNIKGVAMTTLVDLGQLHSLLAAQATSSMSGLLIVIVVAWLVVIFFMFSLLSPPNATALLALLMSSLSVSGAIFLILEMERPFTGLVRLSSQPMVDALQRIGN
jgi:hypothetical protein